ncbi:hypothetical protein PsorP6_000136 [Peronosclerospora sorghi]|uniref:Uncharacterized protein n=1 Tax=Peronosclerospora sorghi TaxID=230839 RepID=A0ACC0WVM6_9STRA|nr:hypothetical protein PsorP6_000136 [Peronosclerospora sorghi]
MKAKQDALVDVIRAIIGPRDMSRGHILAILKQAGDDPNKAVVFFRPRLQMASHQRLTTWNLTTPYHAFYKDAEVDLVQIPGVIGEYGVTAGHAPVLAQLKPGVIKVHVEREKDVHSFFTAGGFALTHANSVTDIACVELVTVEEIDPEAAQAGLTKYQAQLASAPEGSEEKLNAQIGVETHAAMIGLDEETRTNQPGIRHKHYHEFGTYAVYARFSPPSPVLATSGLTSRDASSASPWPESPKKTNLNSGNTAAKRKKLSIL